jgi:Glycosyl transferase family 2
VTAISVLCPTRNRPENVARMAGSAWSAAAEPDGVELVFYEDDDAPGSVPHSLAVVDGVTVVTGPRTMFSAMWNKCMARASGDIFMVCGDDIVFRTTGWDTAVLDAFARYPDGIALVYGDDLIHGAKLASHAFAHRNWTDATGYLTPPYFPSDYCDAWLYDVAEMIGRLVFLPGVVTEHLHPVAGKAAWDQTHRDRLARHARANPAALYASLLGQRADDAAKLRAVMS